MSIIRCIICTLIAISVLALPSVSQAETPGVKQVGQTHVVGNTTITHTTLSDVKEIQCLAKNIYYESANEPEEGKVAVGLVTLNRTVDSRFPSSICGVVHQRLRSGESKHHTVCQFSWTCSKLNSPQSENNCWQESQRIAKLLVLQPAVYKKLQSKYSNALYFHAVSVHPNWSHHKLKIARIGAHWFYRDRVSMNI